MMNLGTVSWFGCLMDRSMGRVKVLLDPQLLVGMLAMMRKLRMSDVTSRERLRPTNDGAGRFRA
jgi:hypothetical protein